MPRRRERVCLQDGLKLDLNRLARKGFINQSLATATADAKNGDRRGTAALSGLPGWGSNDETLTGSVRSAS
jgi:hypothetical protein